MRFNQEWTGMRLDEQTCFPASVPGNIQLDYATYKGIGDVNVGDNVLFYQDIEDVTWKYSCTLNYDLKTGERLYFVSHGIDYIWEIYLNHEQIHAGEGMFSKVELDLTEQVQGENDLLEIIIHPHPKRPGSNPGTRQEADRVCKPPVGYGWDWHPRLLVSGLWQDCYLETRGDAYIGRCEPTYTLSEDYSVAQVQFLVECQDTVQIELTDADGNVCYSGNETSFEIKNPHLWWCNGQGEAYLYQWRVTSRDCERSGYMGFRRIALEMNEGTWDEPRDFPKTRSNVPITVVLNGRRIFAKGSNFVTPDIFTATVTNEHYESLVRTAQNAHMNIFRMWGGSGIQKDSFYDLCDQYGILVWQEFPLACNYYADDPHYLKTLEKEATSIIKHLRSHPSLAIWCGGNELFNGWSGMTEQSWPLRLLNALCYQYDRNTPFLNTSPLMGMAHGPYCFYEDISMNMDVLQIFQQSHHTAYTEFGVPGSASVEILKTFIPEEELFPISDTPAWIRHHAFQAWCPYSWLMLDIIRMYFGEPKSLDEVVYYSAWLQSEGYKGAFEEARRQKPYCSMAINWCYNEPWKTAANNSIVNYPCEPKPAYYELKRSLAPTVLSARIPKFVWEEGELLSAQVWLLNDHFASVSDVCEVYVEIGGETIPLMKWETGEVAANENKLGNTINFILPKADARFFTIHLKSANGYDNQYKLLYRKKGRSEYEGMLNY